MAIFQRPTLPLRGERRESPLTEGRRVFIKGPHEPTPFGIRSHANRHIMQDQKKLGEKGGRQPSKGGKTFTELSQASKQRRVVDWKIRASD